MTGEMEGEEKADNIAKEVQGAQRTEWERVGSARIPRWFHAQVHVDLGVCQRIENQLRHVLFSPSPLRNPTSDRINIRKACSLLSFARSLLPLSSLLFFTSLRPFPTLARDLTPELGGPDAPSPSILLFGPLDCLADFAL